MKITVLGSGGWGTALALLLLDNGNDVTLWSFMEEECRVLREKRENPMLKGVPLPEALHLTSSMDALGESELVVMATPSFAVRATARRAAPLLRQDAVVVSVAKGIEKDTALCLTQVIGEELGGYKGYGYATVVEILSAALQSGLFLRDLDGKNEDGTIRPYHLGHFFLVIDTEAFLGAEAFKETAGTILRELRNSRKAPGQDRIYTAGEKEYEAWLSRKDKGIPLTGEVQKEFILIRDELELPQIRFPFE